MIYYNGYPEKVIIGAHGMSIQDAEHQILLLGGEDNIHPITRMMLWDNYTKARADYWDALFEMDEDAKVQMNELGKKIIAQIEEMYALRDRLLQLELDKKRSGKKSAKTIELETVIQNWYSEDATEKEVDFYSELFSKQTAVRNFCNLCKCHAYMDSEGSYHASSNDWEERCSRLGKDGVLQIVHELKADMNLAWKDMDHILGFEMKVKYSY